MKLFSHWKCWEQGKYNTSKDHDEVRVAEFADRRVPHASGPLCSGILLDRVTRVGKG